MPLSLEWPRLCTLGVDGFLVQFGDRLSEQANRAALTFRAALENQNWDGIEETSTSLVSTYLRFDPQWQTHADLRVMLKGLLAQQDWFTGDLPTGRRLWRVPTVYGTTLAPQLDEAARVAGMTVDEAIASVSQSRVRVQTIGFAPGQPYLGALPPAWNIPRQTALTDKVPEGALAVAIQQLVLFSVTTPTGWRHIGQTAFRLFRPETEQPFVLRPGDEVIFVSTSPETLAQMTRDADGGATSEVIT
ncbi:5-oxoprolinase subunit B family protein [Parasedimentitalea huanghaiensis]|uniref:Carboxyltransferase domain-containing protein n=1 Tax=Parasedimentitalea huanghaiensis TaxID=2682100 RepID=A0A6L6WRD6_9RHOB|nr:allophanate hydrolase subunit 1 [Zongyanglinia huanghaiensis]MVO18092.1 carboxyltransferase domain-containing protein [Zongyanglinia huanghaiensis]